MYAEMKIEEKKNAIRIEEEKKRKKKKYTPGGRKDRSRFCNRLRSTGFQHSRLREFSDRCAGIARSLSRRSNTRNIRDATPASYEYSSLEQDTERTENIPKT